MTRSRWVAVAAVLAVMVVGNVIFLLAGRGQDPGTGTGTGAGDAPASTRQALLGLEPNSH